MIYELYIFMHLVHLLLLFQHYRCGIHTSPRSHAMEDIQLNMQGKIVGICVHLRKRWSKYLRETGGI